MEFYYRFFNVCFNFTFKWEFFNKFADEVSNKSFIVLSIS